MAFPVSLVVYAQLERCIVHKQQKETRLLTTMSLSGKHISVSDNLIQATVDYGLFKWSAQLKNHR